jgi:hypothetical protein
VARMFIDTIDIRLLLQRYNCWIFLSIFLKPVYEGRLKCLSVISVRFSKFIRLPLPYDEGGTRSSSTKCGWEDRCTLKLPNLELHEEPDQLNKLTSPSRTYQSERRSWQGRVIRDAGKLVNTRFRTFGNRHCSLHCQGDLFKADEFRLITC